MGTFKWFRLGTPRNNYDSHAAMQVCLVKALDCLREGLAPFVVRVLTEKDGVRWHQQPRIQRMVSVPAEEYDVTGPSLDIALLLKIITAEAYWHKTFRPKLPGVSLWVNANAEAGYQTYLSS